MHADSETRYVTSIDLQFCIASHTDRYQTDDVKVINIHRPGGISLVGYHFMMTFRIQRPSVNNYFFLTMSWKFQSEWSFFQHWTRALLPHFALENVFRAPKTKIKQDTQHQL